MENPKNLRREVRELQRRRITEEASRLFLKGGYSSTSLDSLAANLGVSKPFMYGIYKSKGDLLFGICIPPIRMGYEIVHDIIQSERSPSEKLAQFVHEFTILICEYKINVGVYLAENKNLTADQQIEIARLRNGTHSGIVKIIQQGQGSGEFDVPDVALSSLMISGMISWVHNWFRPEGRASPHRIAYCFADYAARIVGARRAAEDTARSEPPTKRPAVNYRPTLRAPAPTSAPAQAERTRILGKAIDLFYRQGYEQTTIDALATELGVAKPFIYGHFTSKQEILIEICRTAAGDALQAIEDCYDETVAPTEILKRAISGFLHVLIERQKHVAIFTREQAHLPPETVSELHQLNSSFDEVLRIILLRGVEAREFEIEDVGLAALAISGMVCWSYTWYRPGSNAAAVEEIVVALGLRLAGEDSEARITA